MKMKIQPVKLINAAKAVQGIFIVLNICIGKKFSS